MKSLSLFWRKNMKAALSEICKYPPISSQSLQSTQRREGGIVENN